MSAMDEYQLDNVRRRRAELNAQLAVLQAQQPLIRIYAVELEEIDQFLMAVEAHQEAQDGESLF